jgi:hypothetical protein
MAFKLLNAVANTVEKASLKKKPKMKPKSKPSPDEPDMGADSAEEEKAEGEPVKMVSPFKKKGKM